MKTIPLTKGLEAIVDDEDYHNLAGFNWISAKKSNAIYVQTQVGPKNCRETIQMARMIMGLSKGDKQQVDHINHNPLDNRRYNLRICYMEDNHKNLKHRIKGTSKFKGVYKHSNKKHWIAQIASGKRRMYLGCFLLEECAALAYDFAALKYHREFASFNF